MTPACRLRPPRRDDLDAVFEIHGDPRTNAHRPAGPITDLEEARGLLADWLEDWRARGIGYWVVVDDESVAGFGGVRFMATGEREVLNLYHRLAPRAWGRGIARFLAHRALEAAHERHPDVPVVARMQPGNEPSERTARSAGLTLVGHDPQSRLVYADRPVGAALLAALPRA